MQLIMGDINGKVDHFEEILNQTNFSANDHLIIIGDLIDKSLDSIKVISAVKRLCEAGQCCCVMTDIIADLLDVFENNAYLKEEKFLLEENDMYYTYLENPAIRKEHMDFFKTFPVFIKKDNIVFSHCGDISLQWTDFNIPTTPSFNFPVDENISVFSHYRPGDFKKGAIIYKTENSILFNSPEDTVSAWDIDTGKVYQTRSNKYGY